MKTSLKTFTCATIVSIAFLACDDTGTNNNIEQDGSISSSSSVLSSSSSNEDNCVPNEYEDECISTRISLGVKVWIEEQLASEKNDRQLISVLDYYPPEYEYSAWTAYAVYFNTEYFNGGPWYGGMESCIEERGEGICYYLIDGREVYDIEEYNEWMKKYNKEREEKRRVSPMIGELVSESDYSWIALMTAKEIVELAEKYRGLSIDFIREVIEG